MDSLRRNPQFLTIKHKQNSQLLSIETSGLNDLNLTIFTKLKTTYLSNHKILRGSRNILHTYLSAIKTAFIPTYSNYGDYSLQTNTKVHVSRHNTKLFSLGNATADIDNKCYLSVHSFSCPDACTTTSGTSQCDSQPLQRGSRLRDERGN